MITQRLSAPVVPPGASVRFSAACRELCFSPVRFKAVFVSACLLVAMMGGAAFASSPIAQPLLDPTDTTNSYGSSTSGNFAIAMGGSTYFIAGDSTGTTHNLKLYKTSGTQASTTVVKDFGGGGSFSNLMTTGTLLYFTTRISSVSVLWQSDGTTAGTVQVTGVGGRPGSLTLSGNTLYLSADSDVNGNGNFQLYKCTGDGTATKFTNMNNYGDTGQQVMKAINGVLFWGNLSATGIVDIYRYDPVTTNITKHTSFSSGSSVSSFVVDANGTSLFFAATPGTDGTNSHWFRIESDGTGLVNLTPNGTSANGSGFVKIGSYYYMTLNDGTHGTQIWRSNGTTANGATAFNDGGTRATTLTNSFVALGTKLIFSGTFGGSTGTEPGVIDTTDSNGTSSVLADIFSGSSNSSPANFTVVGSSVYFTATTATSTIKVFQTDGTSAGTVQVTETKSGGSDAPVSLTAVGSSLYYKAQTTDNSTANQRLPFILGGTVVAAPTVTSVSPSSGTTRGGSVITISGTGFTGALGVTIGGTTVTSFRVIDSATIQAVTPQGSTGAKSVVVTTSGGSNSANTLFTYTTPATSTVVDFETAATGSLAANATSFTSSAKTWTLTGFLIGDGTTGLGASPVGAATPSSNGYLDTGFSPPTTNRSPGAIGSIVAPTGNTFRAMGIDIWPSSSGGNAIIPYSSTVSSVPGETGHTFTVKGYRNGSVVVNVDVIDTLCTPPQSGSVGGGYWHHLEFTGTSFDSTDIDKLEIYINTQSGNAFDGPNSGSALATPNYVALDNFVYSNLVAVTPTVTSLSPTSGPATGGTSVTITGTNFTGTTGAAGVKFGSTNATSYTVDSASQITATAPAGTGTVDVTVTNTGGTSATSAADQFTYVPAPTVTLLTPQRGASAGGTSVTITGTNLTGATGVTIGGAAATGVSVVNSTTITCTTPAGTAGTASVVVTTPGGQNGTNTLYTYVDPPTITNSTPIVVAAAGGAGVTLTGTNFTFVQSVTIGGASVPSITIPNNHTITFNAPAGTPGTYDVVVTTSGGSATSVGLFTYAGVPTVTAISPNAGPVDGGASVTITGTNFVSPASVKIGGSSATSVVVVNSTTITCVTPSGGPGTPASVVVTTPGGSNGANALYSYRNPPYINYTGPKSGPTAGGTTVTISGGNFTGTTSVTFNGVAATLGTVGDSSITCTTPAGTAGTTAIVVTAPGGTTTPDGISQFTYVAPPTITGVSPNSGSVAGGTIVTVTGTNLSGATGATVGGVAATNVGALNATTLYLTTPAGTAGTVDVRVTTVGGTSAVVVADQFNYLSATQAIASKTLTQSQPSANFTPVTGSGGTGSLTYSISPSLPLGLSISSSTGAITGSPSVTSSSATYTVTVKDSNNTSASSTFSLTVNAAVTATQAIASRMLTQNQPSVNFTPITGGGGTGALGYGISPALPAGLSLNTSTGAITGSPTATSSATTYTVTVTDSNSATASNTFALTVNAAVTATQSIASKTLTQNQPSANFTPITGGGGTSPLSYSVSPALPTGLSLSTSTGAITGVPAGTSTAATYTVTVTDSNSATASNTFSLTVNSAVTATQAVASKTLTQNQPSANFTPITGGGGTSSLSYGISPALPAGLAFSTSTGAITGIPTATSSATTYTITVTDSNNATDSKTFSLTVNAAVTATQAIASRALTQNQPSANFTPITGGGGTGTLGYSISPALPTGLSLSTSTGAITGIPTATSSATTYTVTVTDSNSATASNTFSLTVNSAVTATQSIASKTLTQNQPSANFTPIVGGGGTSTLGYGISPALPAGLAFSTSTGAITGIPTATSSATTYTVTVTDSNSATASNTFSLTVNSAVTATQAVASTTLAQNQAATVFTPVTGGGGTGTLSYAVSPALPSGLSLSTSTGAVTGTPSVASSATSYTVTVTDANNATASNTFSLTVNPGVGIAATTATAVEGGATGLYTFTRGNSSGDLTVSFQLDASSTATAGTDFTLTSTQGLTFDTGTGAGTVVIPDGSATATITLNALVENPNPAEAAETVRLNLVAGSGYAVNVSPGDNAIVTIAANSFLVTTTSDSGTGSLRQAVLNVNALGGTPTVTFSDGTGGTVNFTDTTPDTITLTSGQLTFDASFVLAGPGAEKLTLDGNGGRIFQINSISSYVISGLSLANGSSSGYGGAAIYCQPSGGVLSGLVVNCSFSQNHSTAQGGAIFHFPYAGASSTLDVIGCSFAQNSTSGAGGGAIGNHGGAGAGGGTAVLRVTNCSFSQNSATAGGSVYNMGSSGTGTATLINCTFAGGSSTNDGTDLLTGSNGTTSVGNCILASSGVAAATTGGGSMISLGHNLTAGSGGPDDHTTDLLNTDPKISALANNGGPTQTLALLDGSPAINAGSNALLPADIFDLDGNSNTAEALPVDQRGVGFPRIQGSIVDIGAYEALLYTPVLSAATTNEDTQSSSGLVITANTADAGGTANYKITGITGGTLYQNDGSTSISSGDYITKAQGAAGLKFTPSADAFSPVTTFGFSVQAALSATDSDLRGSVVAASITVNPVADTPSVTGSATTQNIQSVSGLVISRNDVDGSEVAYFKISNIANGTLYLNDGSTPISAGDYITYAQGSAGLKFTPALDFTGVASFDVQGSIDNVGTGLSGVATASIAVGTVNPTPTQLVPTDPVTGAPLPLGSPYPVISQSGTLEVRISIKNTTAFPINGFRLSVDYSAYLAALPSLRLYNSTSAPGVVPAYIDYPYPVAVGDAVSLKLQFYTSTRRLPDPFSPPLSVTKLSASQVSSTDGSGVQPRIYPLSSGRILLEWDSTLGHWYRVKYSSDLVNWYDSPVPMQAPANRTQWVDDGAPFTDVPPSSVPARYYRVNEISAPTP